MARIPTQLTDRARAHCIRITRIHYHPASLVDFALYFIALFLYLGEQCIRVILRYQGGHTLLPRYQHQTKAAMIKGGLFCKGFVVVAAYFHKSQDMVTQIHCDVQWSTDVTFGSSDTDTVEI